MGVILHSLRGCVHPAVERVEHSAVALTFPGISQIRIGCRRLYHAFAVDNESPRTVGSRAGGRGSGVAGRVSMAEFQWQSPRTVGSRAGGRGSMAEVQWQSFEGRVSKAEVIRIIRDLQGSWEYPRITRGLRTAGPKSGRTLTPVLRPEVRSLGKLVRTTTDCSC
jgi:hypothetical protein